LKYFKPIIDLLKQIPYATWMCDWIQRWWETEDEDVRAQLFEELPQTEDELRKAMQQARGAEKLADEIAQLKEMQENFETHLPHRNLDEMSDEERKEYNKRRNGFLAALNKRVASAVKQNEATIESASDCSSDSETDDDPFTEEEKQILREMYEKESQESKEKDKPKKDKPKKGKFSWSSSQDNAYATSTTSSSTTTTVEEVDPDCTKSDDGWYEHPFVFNPGVFYGNDQTYFDTTVVNDVVENTKSEQMTKIDELLDLQRPDGDRSGLRATTEKLVLKKKSQVVPIGQSFVKGETLPEKLKPQKWDCFEEEEKSRQVGNPVTFVKNCYNGAKDFIWRRFLVVGAMCMGMQCTQAASMCENGEYAPKQCDPEAAKADPKVVHRANTLYVRQWYKKNQGTLKKVFWAGMILLYVGCFYTSYTVTTKAIDYGKTAYRGYVAPGQSKKSRAIRSKTRRHVGGKFIQASGGEELEGDEQEYERKMQEYDDRDYDDHAYEYDEEDLTPTKGRREHIEREREHEPRHRANRQGNITLPDMKSDAPLRRAIYAAKTRTYRAPVNKANILKAEALEIFDQVGRTQLKELTTQWKPMQLACGVYKFYVNDRYACTATQVGNRLYVVLHCLSEDVTVSYRAANHVHSFELKANQAVMVNKEIAYFPINGIPSVWKSKDLRVMEDAEIVTVFGYGGGTSDEPEAIVGFGSPQGWCNAPTRNGDCTAPVLDVNGKIVGFWTHGNGKDFGRFEPITHAFKEQAIDTSPVLHSGLDFRSSPLSQAHC
jgi:hypothetical protein